MEGIRERLREQESKNPGSLYLRLLGNLEVTRQLPTHNRHSLYRNSLYSTLVGAYPAYAWTFPETEYASLVRQSVLLLDAQKQHTALFLSKKQNVPYSDCYTQWALVLSTRNSKTFAPFSFRHWKVYWVFLQQNKDSGAYNFPHGTVFLHYCFYCWSPY